MPTSAEVKRALSANSRICAIMQPAYLPWSGYFGLMASVDMFVLLDDVQYRRRYWQARNRILLNGVEHYLTVPVRKVARETLLLDIELSPEQDWRTHHLQVLRHAYGRHPHGAAVLELISEVFAAGHSHLADLNLALIEAIAKRLDITTPIIKASSLACDGRRSDHLAAICRAVECNRYLSPAGAKEYMAEDRFEENHGIKTSFQQFDPYPYDQLKVENFVSHLSIVDVIANEGFEFAGKYVSQKPQVQP